MLAQVANECWWQCGSLHDGPWHVAIRLINTAKCLRRKRKMHEQPKVWHYIEGWFVLLNPSSSTSFGFNCWICWLNQAWCLPCSVALTICIVVIISLDFASWNSGHKVIVEVSSFIRYSLGSELRRGGKFICSNCEVSSLDLQHMWFWEGTIHTHTHRQHVNIVTKVEQLKETDIISIKLNTH